jgi:hypothetical protein
MDPALIARRRGRPGGQALFELALGLLMLWLSIVAIAHSANLALHQGELQRLLAATFPEGWDGLSTSERRQQIAALAAVPAERFTASSGSGKGRESGGAPRRGPWLPSRLIGFFARTHREEMRARAPDLFPSLFANPGNGAPLHSSLLWDRGSLAGSITLKGALWGLALADAGVNLGGLLGDLGRLGRAGAGRGGESLPESLPGESE